MSSPPKVSIVVPNLKYELLEQFFQNNQKKLAKIDELIIVSSALDKQNVKAWQKNYPRLKFIPITKNKGFAPTVNIGLRAASGELVGTINDDVILNDDWLKNLLECYLKCQKEKIKIGSLNPVIYKESGEVESAGIDILPKGKAIPKKYYLEDGRRQDGKIEWQIVDATNAACVLYTKEALNKVGLFDEKFGSYLEDIDLSLRLKQAGYKNIVCFKSSVIHLGQSTAKELGIKKQLYDLRNWIYIIIKHWGIKKIISYFPQIFIERIRNLGGIIKNI